MNTFSRIITRLFFLECFSENLMFIFRGSGAGYSSWCLIFHKWYQKIVFGGHKKLIFLGVPVSYQGMIAVERTKQYFEKSFDNTNFQLIFYPVHTGNDLVITKI